MNKDLLNEKRKRDKSDNIEKFDKEFIENFNKRKKLEENDIKNDNNNLDGKDISELVYNYNSINLLIKCKICKKEIENNIKLYCNTCDDFIFCINCFINSKHPKTHDYHILDNINFPLYIDDWTANEEHKLLSYISKCGLNNWEEICKSMKNKGKVECESHYYSFYYTNKEDPYPKEDKIILDADKNIMEEKLNSNRELYEAINETFSSNIGKKVEESESGNQNIKRNSRSLTIRKNSGGGAESISEIIGGRPKRNELENEFMNDIELQISNLEFNEFDNEKDLKIKLNVLKDYNLVLEEREKRKKFIFEKDFLDLRKYNRIESKLSMDEYSLFLFMSPFWRFYKNSEFFELFENILIQQKLDLMLKTLNKIENEKNPKIGKISNIEDIEKFLEHEKNLNKSKRQIKSNIHSTTNLNEQNKEKINYENNLIANKIEKNFKFNKILSTKKIDEILEEEEIQLIKEMPMPQSTFYDIKIKIKEIIEQKNILNDKKFNLKEYIETLIYSYGLESKTQNEILEYFFKKYKDLLIIFKENEMDEIKENPNDNINNNEHEEISMISENDETPQDDESVSSHTRNFKKRIKKLVKKSKKRKKIKNNKHKKEKSDENNLMSIEEDTSKINEDNTKI